jgi:hypothetical protein
MVGKKVTLKRKYCLRTGKVRFSRLGKVRYGCSKKVTLKRSDAESIKALISCMAP